MKTQNRFFVIPLLLVVLGVLILLSNYAVIDTDVIAFWPILLIGLGIMILWRGDLAPGWQAHTFGITRGSVETGAVEINSAEIDVRLKALKRSGRLIAGQYTANSRPRLSVRNNHAALVMRRGNTWPFSLADWDLELAQDLPWTLLMSSHLGELNADLRGLVLNQVHIASGIGDIHVICPDQPAGPLYIRSAFGDIHMTIPPHIPAKITVQASPFCTITGAGQFRLQEQKVYTTAAYRAGETALDVIINATFGNIIFTSQD